MVTSASPAHPPLLPAAPASKQFRWWPFRGYNHNVVVTWGLVLILGCADSIWSGTVLASYLYELMGGSNAYAGYVEAAQGLTNLLIALPVGWVADKGSKAKLIAAGALLIPVAVVATAFAVTFGAANPAERLVSFWVFLAAMCLWGIVQAISNGPAQALYADSIPTGSRSHFYTILFALYLLASTLGPLLSICMFVIHGNRWHLTDLRNIFFAGMGFELLGMLLMFCFKDSAALDKTEGGNSAHDLAAVAATPTETQTQSHTITADANAADEPEVSAVRLRYVWAIPYIVFVSSLCFALGSGMTVKFFPLFFKNSCRMSPVEVQAIYLAVPIVMALFSGVGTGLAKRIGRPQTMLLLKAIGIGLLVSMALLSNKWHLHADDGVGSSLAVWQSGILAGVYLIRTGLMNCTYPLEESILMDFVPTNTRARWKSLDSIGVFGWCGSAAVGGYLADRYGYSFTFLITAYVQGTATALQATLVFIVPRSEKVHPQDASATAPLNAADIVTDASSARTVSPADGGQ